MKLRATGQTLGLVESERLVSGSVEIYTAAFEFDPAWDGYAKTAVFTDDMGRSAEIALTDNTCTVPWGNPSGGQVHPYRRIWSKWGQAISDDLHGKWPQGL